VLTSIQKNVVASYLGTGVSAIAPILALPWYISILGTKYWGLVSFIWVLQGILGLINAGLAQALIREISSLIILKENGQKKIAAIFYGFERIYWGFSFCVGILVACFADSIVTHWLKLGDIPVETGQLVIYAAAAIFAVQFPVSLYRSVLFGSGHQIKQNVVISVTTVLRHFGGVMALYIHGSILTYLVWNIFTALIETMVMAYLSWSSLPGNRSGLQWDSSEMLKVFSLTVGLSASVFLGVLALQIDKIVLSWSLPVEQLGYYATASAISIGLLQTFTPIISAVLPKIVQLQGQTNALKLLNLKLLAVMTFIVLVGGLIYSMIGEALLILWLKDVRVVAMVFPALSLLLVGTGLNAIYSVGYINWVAAGKPKKILVVNASALIFSIVFLPILIAKYQLIGAAMGWVTINGIGFLLSMDWIFNNKKASNSV
jgi:O-antigen/teichoic acid export membrane protein